MKKLLAIMLIATVSGAAIADTVNVRQHDFGSGVPGSDGSTAATSVLPEGLYYVPQYLPGNPTAATIWPRVIDVKCVKAADGGANCEGYNWLPEYGRGEYLLIRPIVIEPPVVQKVVPVITKKKAE